MPLSRRQFFGLTLLGLTRKSGRVITGGFVHDSATLGHQIRDRVAFPCPASLAVRRW